MESKHRLIASVTATVSALILGIVIIGNMNSMNADDKIAEMVANGANPIDAYCGLYSGAQTPAPACIVRAAK